jgi:hypothetical protein
MTYPAFRVLPLFVAAGFACGCGSSDDSAADPSSDAGAGVDEGASPGVIPLPDGGTDAPTSTVVSGTVSGVAVTPTETIGVYGQDDVTGVRYAGAWIWNQTGACALAQGGNATPPGSTLMTIEVAATTGMAAIAPATYLFTEPNGVPDDSGIALFVQFASLDTNCTPVIVEDAVAGAVELDIVNATAVAGRFDILFGGADGGTDEVTGTFDGAVCAFDMNNVDTSDMPDACVGSLGDL